MRKRSAAVAAVAGAGVGVLGGLIGLGGAEFRLPLLIGYFLNPLRRAIGLNLGMSLVTVMAALAGRLATGSAAPAAPLHVIVALIGGGVAGAYIGASWLVGASSRALWRRFVGYWRLSARYCSSRPSCLGDRTAWSLVRLPRQRWAW